MRGIKGMIRSRFGLLGLCAIVLGLMAFGTTAAQAEPLARWLILKSDGTLLPDSGLAVPVELEKETTGILHTKIAGVAVLFECEKIAAVNANLLAHGSVGEKLVKEKVGEKEIERGTASKIKFSGCITKLNGTASKPCEPNNSGTEPGVIVTNPGHALIELHEKADKTKVEFVHILPDTGETFATIKTSEECSIGASVPVIGKAYLEDCEGKFLTHLVKHLTQVSTELTELWTISKTAEHVATILGSAWALLGGEHKGLAWGGDPA
jgi:hypothetical protein